jgi:ABC-type oligopeptide transport system substrate-binding subunit
LSVRRTDHNEVLTRSQPRVACVRFAVLACFFACLAAIACTNNPYPNEDDEKKVLYSSFGEAPRTLDPAVAYTPTSHTITGNVFDTLLE